MNSLILNPETSANDLFFEEASSNVTMCQHCEELIDFGEIRVTFERYRQNRYFHLHCFTPITHVRIRLCDVNSSVESPDSKIELNTWIEDWNEQFKLKQQVVNSVNNKRVKSEAPMYRRVFLESFKYLDAVTLVMGAGKVCKGWYHITWEDEIWRELCERTATSLQAKIDFRAEFLKAWFSSCLHCKKFLPDSERNMICPLTSRPKCFQCYQKIENRPQHISWLKTAVNITPACLSRLQIPIFTFDGCECAYLYHIIPMIGYIRRERVKKLFKNENNILKKVFGMKCLKILRSATATELEPLNFPRLRMKAAETEFTCQQQELFAFIEGRGARNIKKLISSLRDKYS